MEAVVEPLELPTTLDTALERPELTLDEAEPEPAYSELRELKSPSPADAYAGILLNAKTQAPDTIPIIIFSLLLICTIPSSNNSINTYAS